MLVVVLPVERRAELDDAERQPLTAENARCDPVPVREGGEAFLAHFEDFTATSSPRTPS